MRISKCRFTIEMVERAEEAWRWCPGCQAEAVCWEDAGGVWPRSLYRARCCGVLRLRHFHPERGRSVHLVSYRREDLES
jgi:hypothetical protein